MKSFYKFSVLLSIALAFTNSQATSFSVSDASLMYDPYGGVDDASVSGGSGKLEYDFSAGTGFGIDYPRTVTVDDGFGFTYDITYTSEIYRIDLSTDCRNSFGCNRFFLDNFTLNDTGGGIIRWDADIQFEDDFFYSVNTTDGGWVTLESIGSGQYQMSPYDYFGDGWQDWNLSAILTAEGPVTVPLPPAIWLLGSGIVAFISAIRLRKSRI